MQDTFNSESCDDDLNYTVILMDSTGLGRVMNQRVITAVNCSDGLCSITFPFIANVGYVNITASNVFGSAPSTRITFGELITYHKTYYNLTN